MSDRFTVDPEILQNVATEVLTAAGEYDKLAKQLMETATNMGEAYKGKENLEYVQQIKGCVDDLNAMVKKLNQVADITSTQGKNYAARSEQNSEDVKGLRN